MSRKSKYDSGFNSLYSQYKHHAKRRKISFDLSKKKFKELTQQDCNYCGVEPKQIHKKRSGYKYNGLDRIDSSKGYTSLNVVPCCSFCNFAKRTLSLEEFKDWIWRIIVFQLGNKTAENNL